MNSVFWNSQQRAEQGHVGGLTQVKFCFCCFKTGSHQPKLASKLLCSQVSLEPLTSYLRPQGLGSLMCATMSSERFHPFFLDFLRQSLSSYQAGLELNMYTRLASILQIST